MKKIQQDLLKSTLIVCAVLTISAFILSFGTYIAQAWVEPDSPPGTEPVAAPLNVSDSTQLKAGSLVIYKSPHANPGLVGENGLSIHVTNTDSAIYVEQSNGSLGWAGYFSGDTAVDGSIYMTGKIVVGPTIPDRGKEGSSDFVGNFTGSIIVDNDSNDAQVCLNGDSGSNCIKSFTPTAFQCNRGDSSCGVGAQTTCAAKCQNAVTPGAGFCASAWVDSKGAFTNFTCSDTATPTGTIRCNCLRFE